MEGSIALFIYYATKIVLSTIKRYLCFRKSMYLYGVRTVTFNLYVRK